MKLKLNEKIQAVETKLINHFKSGTAIDLSEFDSSLYADYELEKAYIGWKNTSTTKYYPVPEDHGLGDFVKSYFYDKNEIFDQKLHDLIIANSIEKVDHTKNLITILNHLSILIARKKLDLTVSKILLDYAVESGI